MRRNNMGMGGRGGGGGGGGPLLTDHLKTLDLELELLKRKRQLIEQQQNEMNQPNAGQMGYNQNRQMSEGRCVAPPRRNFSHSNEESSRDASRRRPVPVWDNEPAGFSGPAVPNKRPLLGSGSRDQGPRPYAFQTKFKRNVAPHGPNKANWTPNKTSSSVPAPKHDKESYILTADVKQCSKASGRLEIALGAVLKEMKAAYNTDKHKALFVKTPFLRIIKQGIRERLRTVMLGKFVGAGPEVVVEYRKAYPPSTDADIIKLAEVEKADQEQGGEIAIKLLDEGDPELFFKRNVAKLLEVKLAEMFQRIEKSYENAPEKSEIVENLPEVKKSPTEESLKVDTRSTTDVNTEKHPKEEEYEKWIALLVERQLPQLLAKHKDDIIKALDLDESFRATKAAIVMKAHNKSLHIAMTEHNISSNAEPELPQNLPYFVKIHVNPSMPKRKPMREFLAQFNPKTIKMHRKNFNLVFVGFDNKEDYGRILKADQTKIGIATITISGYDPKTEQSVVTNVKDKDSNALEQVLSPQLDDQINDLLSSIRNDEEASHGTNRVAITEDVPMEENGTGLKELTDGNDSDVQEVTAEAEVVAIEDDDVAMEIDGSAAVKSEAAEPAPATPAEPGAPDTPSTMRTTRSSRLAQNN